MIDVKIELRQKGVVWEQVACTVELRNQHVPVCWIFQQGSTRRFRRRAAT